MVTRLIFLILTATSLLGQTGNGGFLQHRRDALRPKSSGGGGGGVPAGNAWTSIATNVNTGPSSTGTAPAGAIGDLIVVLNTWEGVGVNVNWYSNDVNGVMSFQGSKVTHTVDGNILHCHIATVVATDASSVPVTVNYTGATGFRAWAVYRLRTTGTISYGSSPGTFNTGTSVSVGTYTTATTNGILLGIVAPYNSCTHSSFAFGGQAAAQLVITSTSSSTFHYLHTAPQSSANFTDTLSTSREWVSKVLSLTSQ